MAEKVLFQTALTGLELTDIEGVGILRTDEFGRIFRWVKNMSSTALIAAGACLRPVTSVSLGSIRRVYTTDVLLV